ncbi:MAG: hypothetical protein U0Q12_05410 [Vicinamibacterales bacterium]
MVAALSLAAAGTLERARTVLAAAVAFPERTGGGGRDCALVNAIANLSGFVGPWVIGWLNGVSGDFHSGLLVLAFVPSWGGAGAPPPSSAGAGGSGRAHR